MSLKGVKDLTGLQSYRQVLIAAEDGEASTADEQEAKQRSRRPKRKKEKPEAGTSERAAAEVATPEAHEARATQSLAGQGKTEAEAEVAAEEVSSNEGGEKTAEESGSSVEDLQAGGEVAGETKVEEAETDAEVCGVATAITVDSAAEESVCPRGWAEQFGLDPVAKGRELKLVNASGGEIPHYGSRQIAFRADEAGRLLHMGFEVADVKKAGCEPHL